MILDTRKLTLTPNSTFQALTIPFFKLLNITNKNEKFIIFTKSGCKKDFDNDIKCFVGDEE